MVKLSTETHTVSAPEEKHCVFLEELRDAGKRERQSGRADAAGETFEQAGWVFPGRKQQLHLYKYVWQDCTC